MVKEQRVLGIFKIVINFVVIKLAVEQVSRSARHVIPLPLLPFISTLALVNKSHVEVTCVVKA